MKIKYLIVGVFLAGCASKASEITPTYVSPILYKDYSCEELAQEGARVSRRASDVAGVVDKNASSDKWATAAAVVIFWPAAFMVKGDGPKAQEYARLQGEMEAIEQASIQKKCSVRFRRSEAKPST